MARTAITTGLALLGRDVGTLAPTAQAADATNGNTIPFTTGSSYGAYGTILAVANGDSSSHTVIIRGSGYTGAANGAANSGIASPQNTVFTQSTVGDFSVAVAAGTTRYIGPLTTDRFAQADGSMWIDWSAGTSMTVTVLQNPITVT
jgi:hypothetical protein